MAEDQRECCRSDSIDTGRLANRSGANSFEFLSSFRGQAADRAIVELWWDYQALVAPKRLDVRELAVEIARILRVDFQLLDDARAEASKLRPYLSEPIERYCWQTQ